MRSIAIAKAPIIVVLLEVKILGTLKDQGRGACGEDAMQRETPFVIVAIKTANEIHAFFGVRITILFHWQTAILAQQKEG